MCKCAELRCENAHIPLPPPVQKSTLPLKMSGLKTAVLGTNLVGIGSDMLADLDTGFALTSWEKAGELYGRYILMRLL